MAHSAAFATRLPADLKQLLDETCRRFGLKKTHVVEQALREKIEDLLDTFDLEEAVKSATGFRPWGEVKKALTGRRSR